MIESCAPPLRGQVTGNAILGKSRGYVIGIARVLKVCRMTRSTGGGRARIVAGGMAKLARNRRMRDAERETRGAMVELDLLPTVHLVTTLARKRKVRRRMIKNLVGLIFFEMARDAVGAQTRKTSHGGTTVA